MTRRLGVGILGAGPVTQAIHLPTLARQADRFRVVSVMDVDAALAATVAGRAGAEPATTIEALLRQPSVDVVAVCSPPQFHAEQVEAICAAGKRGILCEKPLATSRLEATRITAAVEGAGIPLVVGAMHVYDPGWLAGIEALGDRIETAHTVRSTIVLPFNDRYEDWATEIAHRPVAAGASDGPTDAKQRARVMRGLVLGLSVHDLPLIRAFVPEPGTVDHAAFVPPYGGLISYSNGSRRADLVAFMRPLWRPDWRLEAWGSEWSLLVQFTPSYVQAGSASAVVRSDGHAMHLGPWPWNGYEGEWIELHDLVVGGGTAHHTLTDVATDLTYVTGIADQAEAMVLKNAS